MYRCLGVLALLFLTGCQVDSTVAVDVGSDGGGSVAVEVRLDPEAAEAVPDLENQLRVDDLRATGWDVNEPDAEDGFTVLRASHSFDNPDEVAGLIAQLVPEGGPLRDFRIEQQRSLTRVNTTFTGTVDLSQGIASWGDPVLNERVGSPLGVDAQEIETNLGVDLEETFSLAIAVDLPGDETSTPPTNEDGEWAVPYGTVTELSATSSAWNVRPLAFFGLAVIAAVGAVGVAVLWRAYKPKHQRH